MINSAFVQFTFVLLRSHQKYQKQLFLVHLINAFYCYSALFLFYVDWKIKYTYGLWPIPSKTFHTYIIWWFAQVILCFFFIYKKGIARSSGKDKKQYQWIFWATLIAYAGGATNWLVWYDINFPPYLNSGIAIYALVLAYAVFRHQLLGIEVIVKKTIVFTGLLAFFFGIFAFVTFFANEIMSRYIPTGRFTAAFISVFVMIIGYDPLRNLLISVTDKYLFQKKEDIKTILNRLSDSISKMLDIDKVGDTILSTLRETLRLESGAIILVEQDEKSYSVFNSFNIKSTSIKYDRENIFIRYLADHKAIINLEDERVKEGLPVDISSTLAELNAVICISLFLDQQLIGALTFGKKKSDEDFTQEEIDYFPTVAGQVAIALHNARTMDTLKKNQIEFAQQSKMAALGILSAGISHEVKNPLNSIKLAVETLMFNKKRGIYEKLTKAQYETEVNESIERILDNVERANGVITRLSQFAKKPKEMVVAPIQVEEMVESALSLLASEMRHGNIAIQRNYAPNLPMVMADFHAIEEVFVNLFTNARHAMKDHGTLTVTAFQRDAEVEVAVKDTGEGIPQENLEKIFDPFFTTKDTSRASEPGTIKGTGLGLHLARQILKRFGGNLTVESEVGQGTTFHIFLPIFKEAAHAA